MISLFNRRELITVLTQEKLMAVQEALVAAGIGFTVKVRGIARGRTGSFGLRQEATYTYTVFVRKEDYDRGRHAMDAALRNP